ncbi:MAG: TauD/TfdA family dioxygenase, partial [Pseudomonadota bacterium]|nr:TauD/TfdA family dioxygenase [Pseudomonadota bacterium]
MTTTTLAVRPLSSAIGAEISGVDLSRDVNDVVIGEIRQALLDHCVIFFREQEIDTEHHKRLAK